jgi:hypothetical protein
LKVFPKSLKDVYQTIATGALPEGLKMAYIAYTCHLFGDCIQFSILAEKETTLSEHLTNNDQLNSRSAENHHKSDRKNHAACLLR